MTGGTSSSCRTDHVHLHRVQPADCLPNATSEDCGINLVKRVELALKELGCSQKELALKLGVSSTQVSKWKTDPKEHMSTEMERKLSEIARIGERYPRFVAQAGSLKDAIKWEKLVEYQAGLAAFAAETPYDTYLLDTDEDDGNVLRALCWHTFDALQQMGVVLPATFPKELDPKDTLNDTTDTEKHFDVRLTKALERNPYATLIYAIFKSLTSVSGFNSAYIQELMDDDDIGLDGKDFYGSEFEYCLVYLAAAKTEVDEKFAPNFRQFRRQWLKRYEKWVTTIKDRRSGPGCHFASSC
jgi:transcriptional regulator with XRE-family HTH domain